MVAGFRMGGGPDPRSAQHGPQGRPGQYPGQQAPYGSRTPSTPYGQQAPGPYTPPPPYGQAQHGQHGPYGHPGDPGPHGRPDRQWQQPPNHGEPEYFDGHGGHAPHGGHGGHPSGDPGHTQQFSLGEAPDYDPYGQDPGRYDDDQGATYRAGQTTAPPSGPRLHWKDLLSGIVLRPQATFWQMRDHPMWGPALTVTFIYGLLAVFGFDKAREEVLNASLSNSIPAILSTGVAVVLSGLVLGAVTHTLARQLGGDGSWAPTIGLSMLITSITDAPRLLFAMFLGGDGMFVQALGWGTWVAAGALFTSMVGKSHDLPWPKALAASAIQLIALLSLLKLGTI
ncbi:YIP1 family protein [Streptomyces sp. NPDC018031]|uniref:Yip1 family protein n=1 Tax=Streptomyces sp. NPDC018031 TaxID=3365033 RepID=UPI0037B30177